MRLCDICNSPDPFKRQLAIGRISFERTDADLSVPKFKSFDICKACLDKPITVILEKKE